MALNRVDLGIQYFPQFAADRAIANAQIYIGQPNLDPAVLANQIQAYVVQENGTQVAVPQPIRTGAGGVPTYNGSPVQIAVATNQYSVKVLSSTGSQIYYQPNIVQDQLYISAFDFGKAGGNTIANLVGITPATDLPVYYEAVSYYNGYAATLQGPQGGGLLVWDANELKSKHNGGTIISPTVPWNGLNSTLSSFLDGIGETDPSGTGCWVRVCTQGLRNVAYPEWWGGLGDYNASTGLGAESAKSIQKAIDYFGGAAGSTILATEDGGGVIYLSGKYKCSQGIVLKYSVCLQGGPNQVERNNRAYKTTAGLYFFGSAYDAITVGVLGNSNSAVGCSVNGVAIWNSPRDGVVVHGQTFTFNNSAVISAMGNGFVQNTGTLEMFQSHIIGPAKHGIVLNGGDNRITNCEVQQPNSDNGRATYNTLNPATPIAAAEPLNTYDCFNINAGPQQIINCRFGDDAFRSRDNVRITNGSIQITGCDISQNTQAGINIISGNSITITGNRFASASTNANKVGLKIGAAAQIVTVVGNTFNAIGIGGIGGIQILGGASNLLIRDNIDVGNWASPNFLIIASGDRDLITDSIIENGRMRNTGIRLGKPLVGATPSVANAAYSNGFYNLNNAGATTVTNLLNGYPSQFITLLAVNNNTTIQHSNSAIKLAGAANFAMTTGSTLTLVRGDPNFAFGEIWYEVARMVP